MKIKEKIKMPRPKKFSEKDKNFGSRKSKDKQDFLGKKKIESEKEIEKESKDKTLEKEEIKEVEQKQEEFPDTDIAIDVFSPQEKSGGDEKKLDKELEGKKEKLEELKEKAKKLAEKIEVKDNRIEEMREELKEKEAEKQEKKRKRAEKTLFPLDDYVSYSAHLGTKAITPKMREFVYKRRADGLAVLNTNSIDEKLKEACEFIATFSPEDIFLACKREVGWEAAKKFSEATGIKVFTKKYPAGIITNSQLADFFEIELVIVCDPWLDKNALNDAVKIKKPVVALCDTNNLTTGAIKVIPCNNKAGKSLGLILYLMAREYLKARGQEKEAKALQIEDFAGKIEEKGESREIKEDKEGRIIAEKVEVVAESEKTTEKGAKEGV